MLNFTVQGVHGGHHYYGDHAPSPCMGTYITRSGGPAMHVVIDHMHHHPGYTLAEFITHIPLAHAAVIIEARVIAIGQAQQCCGAIHCISFSFFVSGSLLHMGHNIMQTLLACSQR